MLNPRKIGHASPKEKCVSPVIMPNISFKRWGMWLFGVDRKNLKKHEFHCQVQGLVGQLWQDQEGFLFGSKSVGSEMSLERSNELKRFSISLPSAVVSPSGHQNSECPLKSPVKKDTDRFSFLKV